MGFFDFVKSVGRGIGNVFKPAKKVFNKFKPITKMISKLPGVRTVVNTAKNALNTATGVYDDVVNTARAIPVVGGYVDKALNYNVGGLGSLSDARKTAGKVKRTINDYT